MDTRRKIEFLHEQINLILNEEINYFDSIFIEYDIGEILDLIDESSGKRVGSIMITDRDNPKVDPYDEINEIFERYHFVVYSTLEEEAALRNRLKALGYL